MNQNQRVGENPFETPTPYLDYLYETRLILLLETNPQSNEYRQIMLSDEQFKKVSEYLRMLMMQHPKGGFLVPTSEKIHTKLPEIVQSYYDKKLINAAPNQPPPMPPSTYPHA